MFIRCCYACVLVVAVREESTCTRMSFGFTLGWLLLLLLLLILLLLLLLLLLLMLLRSGVVVNPCSCWVRVEWRGG